MRDPDRERLTGAAMEPVIDNYLPCQRKGARDEGGRERAQRALTKTESATRGPIEGRQIHPMIQLRLLLAGERLTQRDKNDLIT